MLRDWILGAIILTTAVVSMVALIWKGEGIPHQPRDIDQKVFVEPGKLTLASTSIAPKQESKPEAKSEQKPAVVPAAPAQAEPPKAEILPTTMLNGSSAPVPPPEVKKAEEPKTETIVKKPQDRLQSELDTPKAEKTAEAEPAPERELAVADTEETVADGPEEELAADRVIVWDFSYESNGFDSEDRFPSDSSEPTIDGDERTTDRYDGDEEERYIPGQHSLHYELGKLRGVIPRGSRTPCCLPHRYRHRGWVHRDYGGFPADVGIPPYVRVGKPPWVYSSGPHRRY